MNFYLYCLLYLYDPRTILRLHPGHDITIKTLLDNRWMDLRSMTKINIQMRLNAMKRAE